jgi:hypothetical protein
MGLGQFFKNIFSSDTRDEPAEQRATTDYDNLIIQATKQIANANYWHSTKATEYSVFNDKVAKLSDTEKVDFILQQINNIAKWRRMNGPYNSDEAKKRHIAQAFIDQLFRSKIDLQEDDIALLTKRFIANKNVLYNHILGWPVKSLVAIVRKKYLNKPVPGDVQASLLAIKAELAIKNVYYEKDGIKLIEQIDNILFVGENDNSVKPVLFLGKDDFAAFANASIDKLPQNQKLQWYKLITLCQKASGSSASKKFLNDGRSLVEVLGVEAFKSMLTDLFSFITQLKEKQVANTYYLQYEFLASVNVECLKGFVWLSSQYADNQLLRHIAAMADRVYKKIPGVGQTCTALGNGCVYALYKADGLEGVSHLSRLKLRVKQASTQALIEKYIRQAATDRGITPDAIEDLAVNDFGLSKGTKQLAIGEFKASISVEKIGRVLLVWEKPDGSTQKSDPLIIKEKYSADLKNLKAECKQIEASLITQRDRLELRFRSAQKSTLSHFKNFHFDHGLVCFITQQIIWSFSKPGELFNGLYLDGRWTDQYGNSFSPDDTYEVSLWHPALDTLENVQQWRRFLIEKQVQQPIKQAFREIYILTDAEINTRVYSNRMAGHILKQHQFNSLAKARGWRYSLQGAFDGGSDGTATLALPEYNLQAQYWTNAVETEAGINDTGIFRYVATDQVRFKDATSCNVINMTDVPALAFSEVMRDVDLFVGVSSVGNDPAWRDSGELPAYRDYWQSYAFGDLNELSKNRKQIIERLLPRLKIAKVATVGDKFLVVKGKKRTYKIHLGSTNILMEPNDQYLCIVPDRAPKDITENVFLPFEGDNGLSIILSKAFLLADDDKITDVTITRQIDR